MPVGWALNTNNSSSLKEQSVTAEVVTAVSSDICCSWSGMDKLCAFDRVLLAT